LFVLTYGIVHTKLSNCLSVKRAKVIFSSVHADAKNESYRSHIETVISKHRHSRLQILPLCPTSDGTKRPTARVPTRRVI